MKSIVFAALLCLVPVADGYAADLPSPGPIPPAYYTPILNYDWSGFYVGINGGYGFGKTNWICRPLRGSELGDCVAKCS